MNTTMQNDANVIDLVNVNATATCLSKYMYVLLGRSWHCSVLALCLLYTALLAASLYR